MEPTNNQQTEATTNRIFRVGEKTIMEDDSTKGLHIEEVRAILTFQYPQVENAQIVEQESEHGMIYNFMAVAGRKG